jgi:hypothetical protein
MKKMLTLFFALTLTLLCQQAFGVVAVQPRGHATPQTTETAGNFMTYQDLLSVTPQQYEALSGKKMPWPQKLALKIAQKKAAKKIAKGKLDPNAAVASGNTLSLLSLIGGAGGLLLIWIPYIGLLGLAMAIAGLVLGLVAMKNEGSNTMNLLGVILGGLTLLLFLVAVIIVATFWRF